MSEPAERTFTIEEANAILEDLRPRLERIRTARLVVFDHGERVREGASGNGGGHEGAEFLEASGALRAEMEWLAERGILLRDAESGLVDFPSEREGRPIYLCWRPGEDRIGFWHDPDTGFAGRRPL